MTGANFTGANLNGAIFGDNITQSQIDSAVPISNYIVNGHIFEPGADLSNTSLMHIMMIVFINKMVFLIFDILILMVLI